mgnify:CR=1 FL=1
MNEEKYKRDYLPQLRRLCKELEDAIVERDGGVEKKTILQLETILRNIRRSKFLKE